jgi:starch synthase (maltosyl-transferring)
VYGPSYEFGENNSIEGKKNITIQKNMKSETTIGSAPTLTDIMSMLNKIRKENAALQSTWNLQFCPIENSQIIAYLKATDDFQILFWLLTSIPTIPNSGYVQLPKAKIEVIDKINVKLHDLITDEQFTWTQEWNYVHLNPHKMPFHLFKLEIHESNM